MAYDRLKLRGLAAVCRDEPDETRWSLLAMEK